MSLYANPKSVRTRIREAIVYQLKQITRNNGYLNTIGKVFTEYPNKSDITEYPAVIIDFGTEKILNEDISDDAWHKDLPVLLIVHLKAQENTSLARETILQDLERHFWKREDDGSYGVLRGADGEATCMVAILDSNARFGMMPNLPDVGITLAFSVRYRQDISDPTVIA